MDAEHFNVRYGWVVVEQQSEPGAEPMFLPLIETVAATRSAAIAQLPGDPDEYANRRRRGEVKAVQCKIMPV